MAIHPSPFTNRGQAQKRRTEVSITHVSHTWRSSALACSAFAHSRWSSKSRVPFDCLSAYLKRSGKRPLDIWIELSSDDMENLDRLFGKLAEDAERWHLEAFEVLKDVEAPNMVSLEMFIPSLTWTSPAPFLKGGTPQLRELRADVKALDGLRFQPFPCLSTLQLETLNVGEFSWSIFLDLLALPYLQTLSIAGEIFQSPEATAKGRTMVAKQLKHFRCSDPEVFCNIWTFVEAPELELLIFIGTPLEGCIFPFAEADTKDDSAHGLFPFLHTLGLLSCQVNAEDTSNALLLAHATKSIQHLYVAQDEEGHDADMGSTSIFWPNLKTLTCLLEMDSDSFDLEPASCLEIVECRAKKM
ncbi:hypothetical protein CVT26_013622 [Gymnopilus dilepis]|uniref:F-box domain-containing protein n=1 Tax=Gymnopilus dilepis TaxID=231916 RepID=A0A409Y5R8_9AGAR|nr:hypothetical protein CVT26_013622 [Gymnopilus dilepis]